MIPQDPIMLLSYVNTKLRDEYKDLDELCRSLDIDKEQLQNKLKEAGFEYVGSLNQFR